MMRFLAIILLVLASALPARAEIDVQTVTSPGGIKAWLVEEHSIPFIALEIRFKGGTSLDLTGKRGATYMMSGLLEEGAGDLDAAAYLKAREELAASFSFDAHGDAVSVSAQFLTENRAQAEELLRKALQQPRFDQAALDRVRAQVVSIIAGNQKDPNQIASDTFDKLAYGDHPYGTPSTGDVDSVNRLNREDMITAYRNALARDRVYVAAVGDISAEQLGVMLDNLLGALPETGAPMPERAKLLLTGGLTVVDLPTPQSVAVFGHAGIRRTDPDFFTAYVMNQVLGANGFTSRLANEVREKRGLTYGVYTYLASYDLADLYLGSVASANDRIAEAIAVIRDEWRKMAEDGITAEELEAAKRYLTGAYPLRFDGNARIAGILANMQLDDLPASYLKTRNDKVNAVTLEDVRRVAKRLMRPEDLRVVVVGQPVGLVSSDKVESE
ncbi:MAG: insulinase family protein [Rhodobacteraceae bacterium]|nr:insulinase family protein [Paracoccaceae bacterium]